MERREGRGGEMEFRRRVGWKLWVDTSRTCPVLGSAELEECIMIAPSLSPLGLPGKDGETAGGPLTRSVPACASR